MPWQHLKRAIGLDKGGHLRNAFEQMTHALGLDKLAQRTPGHSRVAFTIAVVTLAAKMSKADGVSTQIEADAFERVFGVAEEDIGQVRRLYQLAAQDVAGYETYATQVGRLLGDDIDLKIAVLECLFHVASADGIMHPQENSFLETVAERMGLTKVQFQSVHRTFVHDPDSPYQILGISHHATDSELKYRYRELVRNHHPDALMSKGVPEEFLSAAQRRLATINAAYETILAERGRSVEQALERNHP
jgi:DnaJ like chaperone protein